MLCFLIDLLPADLTLPIAILILLFTSYYTVSLKLCNEFWKAGLQDPNINDITLVFTPLFLIIMHMTILIVFSNVQLFSFSHLAWSWYYILRVWIEHTLHMSLPYILFGSICMVNQFTIIYLEIKSCGKVKYGICRIK